MMGMCLVGVPENKVIFLGVRYCVYVRRFGVPIKYLVTGVVGLQIGIAVSMNLALRSEPGHLWRRGRARDRNMDVEDRAR